MSEELKDLARKLGNGSEAEGVRVALQLAQKKTAPNRWKIQIVNAQNIPREFLASDGRAIDLDLVEIFLNKEETASRPAIIAGLLIGKIVA